MIEDECLKAKPNNNSQSLSPTLKTRPEDQASTLEGKSQPRSPPTTWCTSAAAAHFPPPRLTAIIIIIIIIIGTRAETILGLTESESEESVEIKALDEVKVKMS